MAKKGKLKGKNVGQKQNYGKSNAPLQEIEPHRPMTIRITALSPLHLGSGYADINVDADVVQDDVGLPYFPAKRLKGLLYESGLEVAEMAASSGQDLIGKTELDALFQRGCEGDVQIVMHNLYIEHYTAIHDDLAYLQTKCKAIFRSSDVLDSFSNLRWQTAIDRETGIAKATTLHNMRVLEKGITFSGDVQMIGADLRHLNILALAVRNLSQCGGKRTRGFGRIACTLLQKNRDIGTQIVEEVLNEATERGGAPDVRNEDTN